MGADWYAEGASDADEAEEAIRIDPADVDGLASGRDGDGGANILLNMFLALLRTDWTIKR